MSAVVLSDTEPELYSPREKMVLEPPVVVKKKYLGPQVTGLMATIELRVTRQEIRMRRRTAFAKVQNPLLYHTFVTYRSRPSKMDTGSLRTI